ncbi:MAG: hypothetical protein A3E78_11895 [Alphaproteobacteria bacterium RIFCSPHIGHO2_12_FULL_63_12]|nr:MAG: hypothetical protein A3E78_11895 [Alphaproteobacteria bacterium RIFCSPHIGHO2_12_FULL_63_12]
MTNKLRVLKALSECEKATALELGEKVGGIPSNEMSQQLSHLRQQGAIVGIGTIPGSFGRLRSIWAITPRGREMLAEPTRRKWPGMTAPKPTLSAELRQRYKLEHEKHVERQRKAGIAEALIHGELIEYVSPAVR